MILLLGIIGSVGIQNNSGENTKYKLRFSRNVVVNGNTTTQFFETCVDEKGIDNFTKFVDWLSRKGPRYQIASSSFFRTHVVLELKHFPTQSTDSNGDFVFPLYLDMMHYGDSFGVPNIYMLRMNEASSSDYFTYIGMYNNQNWVFEYV